MASPNWVVAYVLWNGAWQVWGQNWEGQGGESIPSIVYARAAATLASCPTCPQNPITVYVFKYSPDTQQWSGAFFTPTQHTDLGTPTPLHIGEYVDFGDSTRLAFAGGKDSNPIVSWMGGGKYLATRTGYEQNVTPVVNGVPASYQIGIQVA